MVTPYCSIQDINEELGAPHTEGLPGDVFIREGGIIDPERVQGLIETVSQLLDEDYGTSYAITLYEDEYYDSLSTGKIKLKHYPVTSIKKIEVYDGNGVWSELTEGRNKSTDDFYLRDAEAGIVGFWEVPSFEIQGIRASYYAGKYEPDGDGSVVSNNTPIYLRRACVINVVILIAQSNIFQEGQKELVPKWKDYIREKKIELGAMIDKYNMSRHESKTFVIGKASASSDISRVVSML